MRCRAMLCAPLAGPTHVRAAADHVCVQGRQKRCTSSMRQRLRRTRRVRRPFWAWGTSGVRLCCCCAPGIRHHGARHGSPALPRLSPKAQMDAARPCTPQPPPRGADNVCAACNSLACHGAASQPASVWRRAAITRMVLCPPSGGSVPTRPIPARKGTPACRCCMRWTHGRLHVHTCHC